MEVPTWIPVVAGRLPSHVKALHVVKDLLESAVILQALEGDPILMASVLDVNAEIIRKLVHMTSQRWILSGYVNPEPFNQYANVTWVDSVDQLSDIDVLDYVPSGRPDYSLFTGEKVIPRITLSEGCKYLCNFCTISREVVERRESDILGQVEALRGLWFDLVYVDDKTFGQAKNWPLLKVLGPYIKSYNPYFRGFVVQTTVPMALKHAEEWANSYHVRYIEVGVEHVDSAYLRKMRKPYTVHQLAALMHHLEDVEVGFIPNLIFGLPSAEYSPTLAWLRRWAHRISFINPFVLSAYGSAKGALVEEANGPTDANENTMAKSWLSPAQQESAEAAMYEAFAITGAPLR